MAGYKLPKEEVEIRYIKRATGLVKDPKHIAFGGLLEDASITLPANRLRSGQYVNVLSIEEKSYCEQALSLPENGLSVYKKDDENYWKTIKIKLGKIPVTLHLEDPIDFIKYKQLESYTDLVAPSLNNVNDKLSYRFVIVKQGDETKIKLNKINSTKEAYKQLGKIEDSREAMLNYLSVKGIKVNKDTSMDWMITRINEDVVDSPVEFVATLTDTQYNTRVLLNKSLITGLIKKKGNQYYSKDGEPLANEKELATLDNVLKFLDDDSNMEYRIFLTTKTDK